MLKTKLHEATASLEDAVKSAWATESAQERVRHLEERNRNLQAEHAGMKQELSRYAEEKEAQEANLYRRIRELEALCDAKGMEVVRLERAVEGDLLSFKGETVCLSTYGDSNRRRMKLVALCTTHMKSCAATQ